MCLCENRRQPQRYSLFNFISFLPRSSNRNMYDTACPCYVLYRRLLVQTTICLLLFSIFVLLAYSGGSTVVQSSKPNHPNTQNMFCCASRSLHSPDWRRLMLLCVAPRGCCSSLVFLFSLNCTPPLFSCQKSCRIPPCTINTGDVRMRGFKSYHKVVKNFKVFVVK